MKAKLLYSTFLSTILLLAGCAKEDNMQSQGGLETTLSLNVSSRANGLSDAESRVDNVRVASFIPANAATLPGRLEINGGKKDLPALGTITQTLRTGVRDIYLFANEDRVGGMTTELNAMQSLDEVKAIRIPYVSPLTAPFMCSYVESAVDIKTDGNTPIDAKVVRTVSKVNLTLTYEWGAGHSLPEELTIKSVQVMHLPSFSYLISKAYDGNSYMDSEVIADSDELANTLTGDPAKSKYVSKPLTIYIPEFLGATATNHAFLEIKGVITSKGIGCTYRLPLSNSMNVDGSIGGNNYNIARNTEFTIAATIKSYGDGDGMNVKVTVLPWQTVNMDEDAGNYVVFRAVTDHATSDVFHDGDNLSDNGVTLEVRCVTNIGSWYTITRDINGVIINKSAPTAPASGNTSQFVLITIPALGAMADGQKYTIDIYQSILAPESAGSLRSLNFTQNAPPIEGLIPSDFLKQMNWPEARLPKKGLQVAKMGNVLPSGIAKDPGDEMLAMWASISTSSSVGFPTPNDLGVGKDNYAKLNALDKAVYQVGHACDHLGPEWYVSSAKELEIIFAYRYNLPTDYDLLTTLRYWSSCESVANPSFYAFVYDPTKGKSEEFSYKTGNIPVRCVREL